MNKRGMDDPESGAYEDDARALERELAVVVRRVLAEELEKPEFRRKLESAVAKAIREQVGAQKRALREEGEGQRRTLGSGARAGQEEDLLRGERGPRPVEAVPRRRDGWRERREEGFSWPRTFRDWAPWLLGACLVLVAAGGVWFAVEKLRPSGAEAAFAQDSLNGPSGQPSSPADDGGSGENTTGGEKAAPAVAPELLDAIWLREIRAAQGALAAGSPLFASTPQAQLDCFFPQTTRDRLDRRSGRFEGDLSPDFDPCVREKFPLARNAPNAAVFAAQALARKLLVSADASGVTWCPKADLGKVQPSQVKPDGLTGPTTFTLLRAVVSCLETEGPAFNAETPAEAYLALSHAALGEIARLAPEG